MSRTEAIDSLAAYEPIIAELLTTPGAEPLIITLSGDLGSGKTTFVQCLGSALGVNGPITSPTFTIMQRYECDHPDFDQLVHIDAYRFESEAEASVLSLPTVLSVPGTVVCIEWPERLGSTLAGYPHWNLHLSLKEGDARCLTMTRTDHP